VFCLDCSRQNTKGEKETGGGTREDQERGARVEELRSRLEWDKRRAGAARDEHAVLVLLLPRRSRQGWDKKRPSGKIKQNR
jgi:hypothetical protein